MKSSIDEISIRAKSVITLGDGELASGKLSRGRWTQLLPGNREFTEREGRLIVIEKFPVAGHNPENCGRGNEFTTTLDARNFKFHPLLFFPTFPSASSANYYLVYGRTGKLTLVDSHHSHHSNLDFF